MVRDGQLRERFSFIEKEDGELSWYKTISNTATRISRAKNFAVGCHLLAQRQQLSKWLADSSEVGVPHHAVLSRIIDDTNVWVEPEPDKNGANTVLDKQGAADPEGGTVSLDTKDTSKRCKLKTKVSSIMGFLQRICVRRERQGLTGLEFAQVHVPAQVLPKVGF